ncbi:HD domain-containing protein [bacterium]|nr:HD domain-containing protein [bacterium]
MKKRDRLHPAELQAILSRFDFIALKEGISMDRDRECVMRSNAAYNLPQEDFQLLEIIRQKNYEDLRGEEKPYLSESEFDCLSISHGNLTPSEIQEMRRHPYGTYKILSKIQFSSDLKNIPKIASEHHEKIDGSGYPHGLKGEEIMLQSQIMGISDIYEALVDKKRPYKPGFSRDEALSIIEREVQEEKIDPVLFEIFKANLDAIVGKST